MRTLLAATAVVLATSGSATAVDADERLGDHSRPQPVRLGLVLLADLKPDRDCLRVQTVPISTGRDLLYRPCQDDIVLPTPRPWGERPPIVIPVVPER